MSLSASVEGSQASLRGHRRIYRTKGLSGLHVRVIFSLSLTRDRRVSDMVTPSPPNLFFDEFSNVNFSLNVSNILPWTDPSLRLLRLQA